MSSTLAALCFAAKTVPPGCLRMDGPGEMFKPSFSDYNQLFMLTRTDKPVSPDRTPSSYSSYSCTMCCRCCYRVWTRRCRPVVSGCLSPSAAQPSATAVMENFAVHSDGLQKINKVILWTVTTNKGPQINSAALDSWQFGVTEAIGPVFMKCTLSGEISAVSLFAPDINYREAAAVLQTPQTYLWLRAVCSALGLAVAWWVNVCCC